MSLHCVEQRTPEWFALRCGRLTASDAKDMLATIKAGEAAARRDLRMRLVCERLTGQPVEDGYANADMQRGVELEGDARQAYEAQTGQLVDTSVGFIAHDACQAGASPDGMVDVGLVELKCPRPARHVGYVKAGTVPAEHRAQLLHQLWVSGARWVDFVSYCPQLPGHLQLFVVRFTRDEAEIAAYADKARAFLDEVDTEVEALLRLKEQR
jgi:putative phage-type endonuclease